jgi:hypothetical protein
MQVARHQENDTYHRYSTSTNLDVITQDAFLGRPNNFPYLVIFNQLGVAADENAPMKATAEMTQMILPPARKSLRSSPRSKLCETTTTRLSEHFECVSKQPPSGIVEGSTSSFAENISGQRTTKNWASSCSGFAARGSFSGESNSSFQSDGASQTSLATWMTRYRKKKLLIEKSRQ